MIFQRILTPFHKTTRMVRGEVEGRLPKHMVYTEGIFHVGSSSERTCLFHFTQIFPTKAIWQLSLRAYYFWTHFHRIPNNFYEKDSLFEASRGHQNKHTALLNTCKSTSLFYCEVSSCLKIKKKKKIPALRDGQFQAPNLRSRYYCLGCLMKAGKIIGNPGWPRRPKVMLRCTAEESPRIWGMHPSISHFLNVPHMLIKTRHNWLNYSGVCFSRKPHSSFNNFFSPPGLSCHV